MPSQLRSGVVGALVAALGSGTACAAPPGDLGFYGFVDYDAAVGVSDNGTVAIREQSGYIWTVGGGLVPVDAPLVWRISANGQHLLGDVGNHAYRSTIGGAFMPIPAPPGGFNNFPGAISADGSVAVGFEATLNQGWMWREGVGTVAIQPPGTQFGEAYDVSRDGMRVVGRASGKPFIYTHGAGYQTLPALNDHEVTAFRRISADGQIIVGTGYTGGSTVQVGEAFRWTPQSGYVSLGEIGPVPGTFIQTYFADAVNGDGTLIGGSQGSRRAWIWDPVNGMRDLKQVLVGDYGFNLDGWTLEQVFDISADGRYIVGAGFFTSGTANIQSSFVAIIPSPAGAGALMVAGILCLARRRRAAAE